MDFQLLKSEVKELILQELSTAKVETEEQFQDRIHDITHTELDNQISELSLIEIGEILMDFGFDKALHIAMNNMGLVLCPSFGENIYSPAILYQAVMENMSITWEDYQEYKEEEHECDTDCDCPSFCDHGLEHCKECDGDDEGDEGDEDDEDDEKNSDTN